MIILTRIHNLLRCYNQAQDGHMQEGGVQVVR
jgi:hypothetical protein